MSATSPCGRRVDPGLLDREAALRLGLGARAEDAAVGRLDGHVVDAGLPAAHGALGVELRQLVAVAAPALPVGVVPLVLEPDGDPVVGERPQLLAERVVELALPQ